MHEPAFVAASLPDNDGNRRGDLFRGNVKARHKGRKVAVKVPANADIAKLKRSCDSAAHLHSRAIGERWYRRLFWLLFLLRFLSDRLRRLSRLDLARTPKKWHKHQK
jgi:hypothetical protein